MRSDTAGKLVIFSGKPAKIPSKLLLYRRQTNRHMTRDESGIALWWNLV